MIDILALVSVSRDLVKAISDDRDGFFGAGILPLKVRKISPREFLKKDAAHSTIVAPVPFCQTAVLLQPKLWGCGRTLCTQVEIELRSCKVVNGFAFGIVPDRIFHQNAQLSREASHVMDCLGRLWRPGGGQRQKELYGRRLFEGDRLALTIRPEDGRVHGSFLINGESLGPAFDIAAEQVCSPVIYFNPVQEPNVVQIRLIQEAATSYKKSRIWQGLVLQDVSPGAMNWEEFPLSVEEISQLEVEGLCSKLAERLTAKGPGTVLPEQVELLIGGSCIEERSKSLSDVIHFRHGTHLEDLYWNIPHLVS